MELEHQSLFAMVPTLVTALKLMKLLSIEQEDQERELPLEIQIMLRILQFLPRILEELLILWLKEILLVLEWTQDQELE